MKVIIQISGKDQGGVLVWLKAFSKVLLQNGDEVFYASFSKGLGADLLSEFGSVYYLPFDQKVVYAKVFWESPIQNILNVFKNALSARKNSRFYKKIIKENSIDCILINGHLSIPVVKLENKKIPVISVIHTVPSIDKTPFKLKSRYIGLALNKVERVVCVGKIIQEQLQPYTRSEIEFIPNGTSDCFLSKEPEFLLKEKYGLPVGSICIGSIGRFTRDKGYLEIIHVFEKLSLEYVNLHCVLAGSPSNEEDQLYYEEVKKYVNNSKFRNKIHLLGFIKSVEFYNIIDIFYLYRIHSIEAFGLVIIEAMSAYKPVIAPNIGGPKDIIDDNTTGYLVQPGSIDEYVYYTRQILNNVAAVEDLTKKAREEYVNKYSIKIWGDRWIYLLENMLV